MPNEELDAAARELAAALLAAPRNAVIETKALLQGAGARSYDEQRSAERAAQARRLRDLAGLRRLTAQRATRDPEGPGFQWRRALRRARRCMPGVRKMPGGVVRGGMSELGVIAV